MQAQLATIEAGISLVLIASAVSFVSSWVSSSSAMSYAQSASLRRSMAVYDTLNALGQNATYNDCVSALYLGNGANCIANLEATLSAIFSTDRVEVKIGSVQSNSSSACAPVFLEEANATVSVCVSVS